MRARLGPVRAWALAITALAFLSFLFPLKVYIHGVPWNGLPPLAWKAIPRTVIDNRTPPLRVLSVVDNEDFRLLYWGWVTRQRSGWRSEAASYPTGILVVADTLRLNLLPDRNLAVLIYRSPVANGSDIELVKEVPSGEMAGFVKAVAGLSEGTPGLKMLH